MKILKKSGWAEYITITFYIGFVLIPFVVFKGFNIQEGLVGIFKTFPTNYLLYFAPAILYFFIKKTTLNESDKIKYLFVADVLILTALYVTLANSSGNLYFTVAAIIVISAICININDITAGITLLPGLLLTKLGVGYIFATYIPVLLLMLLKYCKKSDDKRKNKSSGFIVFAYLYIALLAILLIFTKKITFYAVPVNHDFTNFSFLLNFTAGIILIIAACVMFIIRAMPVIKNGETKERIVIILFAVYPLIFTTAGFFINLISNNFKLVFLTSLIIYTVENIQLSITYNEKICPIIPEKIRKTTWAVAASVIFCIFCFK